MLARSYIGGAQENRDGKRAVLFLPLLDVSVVQRREALDKNRVGWARPSSRQPKLKRHDQGAVELETLSKRVPFAFVVEPELEKVSVIALVGFPQAKWRAKREDADFGGDVEVVGAQLPVHDVFYRLGERPLLDDAVAGLQSATILLVPAERPILDLTPPACQFWMP